MASSVDEQLLCLLQRGATEHLMMIGAYFDESGKFKDHSMVSLAGVAGMPMDFNPFGEQWQRELHRAGLRLLTMKDALNVSLPLSKKRPAKGFRKRIDALMPFAECIRKHLQFVICTAVDATAFKKLPSEAQRLLGNNPHYVAFITTLLDILEPVRKEDTLSIICDDDEQTAWPMYKLYRKVKLAWPDARTRLVSISFANDQFFVPLQAADMIASLTRLDARRKIHGEDNPYQDLLDSFTKPADTDRLWGFNTAILESDGLTDLARNFAEARRKYGADAALLDTRMA